jgi:hypothetical protein
MGMYTELMLSTNIVDDPEVVEILQYMCTGEAEPKALPAHPLFLETERWEYMFRCSSYYHTPRSHASIEYDKIGKYWTLIVRSDFKNYYAEIEKFVNWISPYVDAGDGDMIGYSRYEEDKNPIILRKGQYASLES